MNFEAINEAIRNHGLTTQQAANALQEVVELIPPIHPFMFAIRKELYPDENWDEEEKKAWKTWGEYLENNKRRQHGHQQNQKTTDQA